MTGLMFVMKCHCRFWLSAKMLSLNSSEILIEGVSVNGPRWAEGARSPKNSTGYDEIGGPGLCGVRRGVMTDGRDGSFVPDGEGAGVGDGDGAWAHAWDAINPTATPTTTPTRRTGASRALTPILARTCDTGNIVGADHRSPTVNS